MKKCRYSINGKCTNDNVACNICYSTDNEMISCAPLQKSIIIYNDNWFVETEENKQDQIVSIANERISSLVEELVSAEKTIVGNGDCPYYRYTRRCKIENVSCDQCMEEYFDELKAKLLEENLLK